MNKLWKPILISTVVIIFLVVVAISSIIIFHWEYWFFPPKDYQKDLIVTVPDSDVTLVIKEWSWGLGSEAEIYIKDGKNEEYLRSVSCGDDGETPFKDGKYEIINMNDGTIKIITNGTMHIETIIEIPEKYHNELIKEK